MKSNPPRAVSGELAHTARGETATPLHQLTGEVASTRAILHWGDRRQISIRVSCIWALGAYFTRIHSNTRMRNQSQIPSSSPLHVPNLYWTPVREAGTAGLSLVLNLIQQWKVAQPFHPSPYGPCCISWGPEVLTPLSYSKLPLQLCQKCVAWSVFLT